MRYNKGDILIATEDFSFFIKTHSYIVVDSFLIDLTYIIVVGKKGSLVVHKLSESNVDSNFKKRCELRDDKINSLFD